MTNFVDMTHSARRQFGLDFVRAVAIFLVLLSHFAKTLDCLGFWGVELFFGLSGYLIGKILWINFSKNRAWSGSHIVNFWSRRWWRTLPSYYLFFFVTLLISFLFNQPVPPFNTLSKFVWFGQSFTKHYGWFYGVSWSLCVEEWFYILFPLLLFLFNSFGLKKRLSFSLSMLFVFLTCFLIRQVLANQGIGEDLRLITVARLDAIVSGVFIAYCMSIFDVSKRQKILLFIAGIAMMAASIAIPYGLAMSFEMIKGNTYLLLSTPLSGALMLPFFALVKRPMGVFKMVSYSVEKLSLWSYSIYLSHMPILITIYNLEDRIGLENFRSTIYGNIATKTVGILIIIVASALLFTYFESPLTKRRPDEIRHLIKPVNV